MPWEHIDSHRIGFSQGLAAKDVQDLASNANVRILQCSAPIEPSTWDLLNNILLVQRPEIEVRVYGFYSSICDLSFVERLRNVRRFSADCLRQAIGIEHLGSLESLEKLSVGIYSLENFDFLKSIPAGIKSLSLHRTKSKEPRLDVLSRFHSLSQLYLESQEQGIEVLSELSTLEDITLRSISTPNLDYIARLPRLWSLDVKLGGIEDFFSIAGKESIKYLELWQIRRLADISFISSLVGLQFLFLQSLRNVTKIPDLSGLSKLRRIYVENMKGLRDVSAIAHAPSLEEFIHVSAQNIAPDKYAELLEMPTLKGVSVGFGSQKKNQKFKDLAASCGKEEYVRAEFVFQ